MSTIARPSVIHTGDDELFVWLSKKKFSHNFLGTFQFSSKFATLSFAAVGLSNYIKRTSCEREKFTDTGTDNAKDNELIGVKRKMFA